MATEGTATVTTRPVSPMLDAEAAEILAMAGLDVERRPGRLMLESIASPTKCPTPSSPGHDVPDPPGMAPRFSTVAGAVGPGDSVRDVVSPLPGQSATGAGGGAGAGAGGGGGGSPAQRARRTVSSYTSGSRKPPPRRKLWKRAIKKVMAVQMLTTAHDRWMAEHGGTATVGHSIRRQSIVAGAGHRNTRKAKRREYDRAFGGGGATIQKNKVLQHLNEAVAAERQHATSGDGALSLSLAQADMYASTRPTMSLGHSRRISDPGAMLSSPTPRAVMESRHMSMRELAAKPPRGEACRTFCPRMFYHAEEALTGRCGKPCGLIGIAVLQVVLGALALTSTQIDVDGDPAGETQLAESLWQSWTYVSNPGTQSAEVMWLRRLVAFIITLFGILLFAAVVGFVVDSIRTRLEDFKRGKSSVMEKNHYLILGWSDKSFSLIRELCLAMESEGGGVIVILSERDKEEIDAEIREQFRQRALCGTKVVCRTGSPLLVGDLAKVSAPDARAIIILAEAGEPDKADAKVLRTVLCLMGLRRNLSAHVVAELRDVDNEGLVQIIGKGWVETVVSHDIIGRLMLKCARLPGLADAYEMLLGFEGDEFYLSTWPQLTGTRFADLPFFFPNAIPIGIKRKGGYLVLNPPHDIKMAEGDELLVLAEDDDTYAPEPARVVESDGPTDFHEPLKQPEKILFANSRRDMDDMVDLLDRLVVPGSELHFVSEVPVEERIRRMNDGGVSPESLENLTLVHHFGNPSFRRHLERLPLEQYTSVLVLADENLESDSMHSDSSCLATLLLIRHIQESRLAQMDSSRLDGEFSLLTSNKDSPHGRKKIKPSRKARRSRHSPSDSSQRRTLRGSSSHGSSHSSLTSLPPTPSFAVPAGSAAARAALAPKQAASAARITARGKARGIGSDVVSKYAMSIVDSGQSAATLASFSESKASMMEPTPPRRRRRNSVNSAQLGAMSSFAFSEAGDAVTTDQPRFSRMACELLDVRTRSVVQENVAIASLSDYILSNAITSRVIAMIAERREVKNVLDELLGPEGQEVALKTCAAYIADGEELSFWEVSLRAHKHHEILLGYKIFGSLEIVTNPVEKHRRRTWSKLDSVVVLATDTAYGPLMDIVF